MSRPSKRRKFRSTLEASVIADLKEAQALFQYEPYKISYRPKMSTYLPDIILENGIIVEVKGWFQSADRTKHLLIKQQHPHLDIRFVFERAHQKITKGSKTTYAMWCDKNGFKWAEKVVPASWLTEGN